MMADGMDNETTRIADDRLLSIADLVQLTGLGERTLRRWLTTTLLPGPDYRLGGKHLRWRRSTIDAWLTNQATGSNQSV